MKQHSGDFVKVAGSIPDVFQARTGVVWGALNTRVQSAIVQGGALRIRIWPILTVGFGALIAVLALSGWLAFQRSTTTYTGISELYESEHEAQLSLTSVRSNITASAILFRDFLIDEKLSADAARSQMNQLQLSTETELMHLDRLTPGAQKPKLDSLRKQVVAYWSSVESMLTGDARQRSHLGYSFLQTEFLPRRKAAMNVVAQIEQLSWEALKQRRNEIDAKNAELAYYLGRMVAITILIAFAVAGVSVYRTYSLERASVLQHQKMQAAESELRRLSQQLVRTQEDERRALSRDLHDQVGQVLTALRMSLGNLELAVNGSDGRTGRELELAKRLAGQALRSTRDLAMGLRPTMLDDLGLEAALEWYGRQHAKIYGVPVSVRVRTALDQLLDAHRTCVYRIVQEALNNSGKYAQAGNVEIALGCSGGWVALEIGDDGSGFDLTNGAGRGLGLLGMRERVAQLGGTLVIESRPEHGTRISVRLPLSPTMI